MKLFSFDINNEMNFIAQFPVFKYSTVYSKTTLYQIETVPVPTLDFNDKVNSYTKLQVVQPYFALNEKTCISLKCKELRNYKNTSNEFYCEKLINKCKSTYSCESAITI